MKKVFLSFSVILMLSVANVSAADGRPVTKEVQAAFKKEFPAAEGLSWNEVGDFCRAAFLLDGHRVEAYFSDDGKLQGSIRDIFFSQLPMAAMSAIEKKYAGADVSEVNEITNDEGTIYRVSLESLGKKYRVKIDANGNIAQADKLKK
jgi:hypothetical protein